MKDNNVKNENEKVNKFCLAVFFSCVRKRINDLHLNVNLQLL